MKRFSYFTLLQMSFAKASFPELPRREGSRKGRGTAAELQLKMEEEYN